MLIQPIMSGGYPGVCFWTNLKLFYVKSYSGALILCVLTFLALTTLADIFYLHCTGAKIHLCNFCNVTAIY